MKQYIWLKGSMICFSVEVPKEIQDGILEQMQELFRKEVNKNLIMLVALYQAEQSP